jgi:acid phosphatase (class A)
MFFLAINMVHANDIDKLRFPLSAWDGQVLNKLIIGPGYLDKNLEFDLPPPPSNSSMETQNELMLLKKYAKDERTEEQVEKILVEAKHGEFSEIYLDEGPIEESLRNASYRILKFTDNEIVYFIVHNKKRFSRPRPSQLIPELELVVPNPGHAAYPSGHATQSMVFSKILSLIDPENESTYISYAKDIAKRREIAGVHYPSDSATGQLLAGKLVKVLMQEPEFIKLLDLTKTRYHQSKDNDI